MVIANNSAQGKMKLETLAVEMYNYTGLLQEFAKVVDKYNHTGSFSEDLKVVGKNNYTGFVLGGLEGC